MVVNDETIGTVHKDVDDGETSYSIHLTVLEEDLPAAKPSPPAQAPGREGKHAPGALAHRGNALEARREQSDRPRPYVAE